MRFQSSCTLSVLLAISIGGSAIAAEMSDEQIVENAMSAAPESVAANAAVIAFDASMQMRTLQEGTNGFTCMADDPVTPTNDPMCLDANGMEWANAWMTKGTPPEGKVGFGYMLMGGSAANNTDPYATAPAAGEEWFEDRPHVMILNAGAMLAGYPRPTGVPDVTQPYVMWPDTPYEHLMVPVQ